MQPRLSSLNVKPLKEKENETTGEGREGKSVSIQIDERDLNDTEGMPFGS